MKKEIGISILCVGQGHYNDALCFYNNINSKYKIKKILLHSYDEDIESWTERVKKSILFEDSPDIKSKAFEFLEKNDLLKGFGIEIIDKMVNYTNLKIEFDNYFIDCNIHISFFGYDHISKIIPTLSISRLWFTLSPVIDPLRYIYKPLEFLTPYRKKVKFSAWTLFPDEKNILKGPLEYLPLRNYQETLILPPLISKYKIERNVIPNTCLMYARDKQFLIYLPSLVKNNANFKFNVFTNHEPIYINKSITYYKCGDLFKEFLKTTQCVIAMSGYALTIECLYSNIPIAIMYNNQIFDLEQQVNLEYCKTYMHILIPDINLSSLKNKDTFNMEKFTEWLNQGEQKCLQLVDSLFI